MREVIVSGIVEVVRDDGVDGCELCEACSDCSGVHVLLATRSGRVGVHLAPALARRALAAALRAARPTARQGDIFSPEIARVFRRLVAEAFEGRNIDTHLIDLYDDHRPLPYAVRPDVNDPYRQGATHAVPPILLQRLPALLPDIEYRIVNYDLVLWDVHADLVIDLVPDALGPRTTT